MSIEQYKAIFLLCSRDSMVVGFTTTYAISTIQNYVIKFVSDLWPNDIFFEYPGFLHQ